MLVLLNAEITPTHTALTSPQWQTVLYYTAVMCSGLLSINIDATYSAMSEWPQEAATCRGVHPSLSTWFTLAPCSKRKVTISMLPSIQACVQEIKHKKTLHVTHHHAFYMLVKPPHLVEGSDSICVRAVDNFCHVIPVSPFGVFGVHQHHLGLLYVATSTGSQELCSPVKPHPFSKDRMQALT